MQMSEIFTSVKSLAENDQSIQNSDITIWVDNGINRINQALKTNIPLTTGKPTTYVPEFDIRFHEALVLFAVAKYRESDSDYNSAQYFLQTFSDMVNVMQRDMTISPSMRVDDNVQQIVVANASTLTYNLIMDYGSYFDTLTIYQNDNVVDSNYYSINMDKRQLTFKGLTLAIGDKITILFENNSDLSNPPYQWWGQTGW